MWSLQSARARWLELGMIGGLLLAIFCINIRHASFHPDESHWIASSRSFEAFVGGQWDSPIWRQSYWTLTQPPVTRYIIGIGRRLGGYQQVNIPWDFRQDDRANLARGAMPGADLLWWARLPMAILAVVSGIVAFILVRRAAGRIAGYLTLLLFVANPYFLSNLGRAMGESPLLTATLLAILCGDQALRRWQPVAAQTVHSLAAFLRPALWFGAMGLFCGIAGATKLNGFSLLPAGVALCFFMAFAQKGSLSRSRRLGIFVLTGTPLVFAAGVTFVALNPYLHPDPLGRTIKMMGYRLIEMKRQHTSFPLQRVESSPIPRLTLIGARVFGSQTALRFSKSWIINVPLCLLGFYWLFSVTWGVATGRYGFRNEPCALICLSYLCSSSSVHSIRLGSLLSLPGIF